MNFPPNPRTVISDSIMILDRAEELNDISDDHDRLDAAHATLNVSMTLMNEYPREMFSDEEQDVVVRGYRLAITTLAEMFAQEEEEEWFADEH